MVPRPVLNFPEDVVYGERWHEAAWEYRFVQLPREIYRLYKAHQTAAHQTAAHQTAAAAGAKSESKLLAEAEWRALGLQMSPGWENYMIWSKEPNILCFRKPGPPSSSAA